MNENDRAIENDQSISKVEPEVSRSQSYRRPILLGLCLACASNFQIGFSITYMNAPVAKFQDFLNHSSISRGYGPMSESTYAFTWGLFLNLWLMGFGIGVWLNPFFNDKLGRKTGFLCMNVLSATGSVLRCVGVLTGIYELLLIGQFTAAIAVAVTYQSLILLLQECSPTSVRGLLSCCSESAVAIFSIVGTFIGIETVLGHNLLFVVGFALIPSIIGVIVLLPMQESPKFLLCFRDDRDAAARSIRFYHGKKANVDEVLEAIEKEDEQESRGESSYAEILTTPHLRKAILLGLMALQQTTVLWVIFFSSTFFLQEVKIDSRTATWASTAVVFLYALGSIIGSSFVDRFGRRKLVLPSAFTALLFLSLYVLCALLKIGYGCIFSLLSYTFIYGFGTGPVCWFIGSELITQKHRSRVQVLNYFINMIITIGLTSTIMPLFKAIGPSAFIVLYILPGFASLFVLYKKLPETRGREIHEIVSELKGQTKDQLLTN
ncbi:MFS domain-containing protein [Aphelenchoides besseyi]|nr:MFS domain-containing protein [Aphelenchoides besseyi]